MGNRLRTASEPLPSMRFLANCLRQMPLSSSAHQCYARGAVRLSGRSFISKVTYLIPWPVKRAFPQHWPPAWKRGRKRFFGAQLSMYTHATLNVYTRNKGNFKHTARSWLNFARVVHLERLSVVFTKSRTCWRTATTFYFPSKTLGDFSPYLSSAQRVAP
jgi:hypothetical protein